MKLRAVVLGQWYRIDKQTGQLLAVNGLAVARAASGNFNKPIDTVMTGRFQTPYAIYSMGKFLTDTERQVKD